MNTYINKFYFFLSIKYNDLKMHIAKKNNMGFENVDYFWILKHFVCFTFHTI